MTESNVQNKVVANISTWQKPWSYDHLKLGFQMKFNKYDFYINTYHIHATHTH